MAKKGKRPAHKAAKTRKPTQRELAAATAQLTNIFGAQGAKEPQTTAGEIADGNTPPTQALVVPQLDMVRGRSGRANFWGLPQWDEHNPKLIGMAGQLTFDAMYRNDPDIRRLITMVSAPIQAGSWTMQPYGGDDAEDSDREIADAIWWVLNDFMCPSFVQHLGEAVPLVARAGFAPFEQIWTTTDYVGENMKKTLTVPKTLQVRLPRSIWRWFQDDYGKMTQIGQIIPNRALVEIPASELTYYRCGAEGDNWMGVSMLRSAYKPWVYKDRLERIDAIGQERKAIGVPVVYPPMNADPQTKGQVETMVASAHTSEVSFMMMPGPKQGLTGMAPGEGWLIDVIKFDSSSGESVQTSLNYHQMAIARAVLGDFMELGHHQVGARATADVQEDPFLTAEQAFAEIAILPPLNELVDRIRQLNWPDAKGSPFLTLNLTDAASLSEIAAYVSLLVQAEAMQVDPELEDWLRERADLPAANGDIRALKQAAMEQGLKNAAEPPPPMSPVNPVSQTPPQMAKPGQGPQQSQTGGQRAPATNSGGKSLDTPSAKWWESLLSQGKLKQAFDGARQSVENVALDAAKPIAHSIATGGTIDPQDMDSLAGKLQGEYERLYQLGHDTVQAEFAKQRKTLMTPSEVAGAVGARFVRAKHRAQMSASNIAQDIRRRLGQQQVTGLTGPQLSQAAIDAARASLHLEALDNATAMVNDGRYDSAMSTPGVVGAYYTSCLDENTCDECEADDTGILLDAGEASDLGPPNPQCAGGDRCRCCLVWVLSDDPTAIQSITG